MSIAKDFCAQLSEKINCFFSDQQQGLDIPPAELYRLEGFIEAGLLAGFILESEVKQRFIDGAEQYLSTEIADFYRQDYRLILHMRMNEAPVYPSSNTS